MTTSETPTGRLRFVLRTTYNVAHGPWEYRVRVLQQEWRVITGNHKDRTERTEWRDVPMVEGE